jgi:hypothetical protein
MLNFWKEGSDRREHCGQVLFELEMIEVCQNMLVTFSNVVLKDWNPMPFQSSSLRLDYIYGEMYVNPTQPNPTRSCSCSE